MNIDIYCKGGLIGHEYKRVGSIKSKIGLQPVIKLGKKEYLVIDKMAVIDLRTKEVSVRYDVTELHTVHGEKRI